MSQHYLQTVNSEGQNVQVQTGFDRPLNEFYCTVFNLDTKEDDDENVLFSTIPTGGTSDFEDILEALSGMGIHLPEKMVEEIEMDAILGIGNKIVDHTPA